MTFPLEYGAAALAALALPPVAMRQLRGRRQRNRLRDPLTGLADRHLFASRLEHALLRARRHQLWVAVLAIDVDELATVNNTMGRECGDELLRRISGRLVDLAREEDTVARLGSDEFMILLEQIEDATGAARAAARILDGFQVPETIEQRAVVPNLSIGISVDRGGARDADTLIRESGIALARAKARGKRRFETFEPPMGAEATARLTLEAELQQAIAREELRVQYQPIVDLATGSVVGAEALARWEHPERGLLYPADFIAMAESSGTIVALGRAVLREACRTGAAVRAIGPATRDFRMSVNVSPRQFRDADSLLSTVQSALLTSGLPPNLLTLEITESSLLDNVEAAVALVERLRGMQIGVSLDDFGTGYSSLAYMRRIPVSGLKIDQSFVATLDEPATGAIVRGILDIAAELDICVTAEGAENEGQVGRLRELGCPLVQGHHFGEAIPEAALLRLMRRQLPMQHVAAQDALERPNHLRVVPPPDHRATG